MDSRPAQHIFTGEAMSEKPAMLRRCVYRAPLDSRSAVKCGRRLLFLRNDVVMRGLAVRRSLLVCLLALSAVFCGLTAQASAQTQTGSISGTLVDPAGAALRGAQVSIPD